MNTPVNFEIVKMLKEKGVDELCDSWYYDDGSYHDNPTEWINSKLAETNYSRPTIAEVVMFLYEKHGIWIRITPIPYSDNLTHWRWEHMSTKYATRNACWKKEEDYMSPTEAYEAAIIYTLNNLI